MTRNSNTPLTTEQLLHDDQFVQAVLAGSAAVEAYKSSCLSHFPNSEGVVESARRAILDMQQSYQAQSPSSKTIRKILDRIRSSDRD